MRVNINNIIISLNKDQDKEILKEIERKGIKRENIKGCMREMIFIYFLE